MVGRERGQRLFDPSALLGACGRRVRPRVVGLVDEHTVPILLGDPLGAERATARRACAQPIGRHVHHDPEQPRVERRLAAEVGQGLPRSHEGFLRYVPRFLPIAHHVVGEAPHTLAVLLDQRLEGRNVAGATSLDEGGIVGFHVLWAAPRALRRLDARVAVFIVAGPCGSPACSRAGRGRTQAQERIETEQIALWAETRDLASCDGRDD